MTTMRSPSDDDVVAVMARLGRAVPAYAGDLTIVERRVRLRRYRRRAVAATLATVAVFAATSAIVATRAVQSDGLVVADGVVATLDSVAGTQIPVNGWASNHGDTATVRSLVDGRLVEHLRLGAGESVIDVASTQDGGLYVLTSRGTTQAAGDDPNLDGLSYPLLRLDGGGRVAWTRDLRVVGEYVRLVAASPHRVVLRRWAAGRPSSLVELDVRSGAERRLATVEGEPVPGSFIGDRVVTALNTSNGCSLVEIDNRGEMTRRVEVPGCREALAVAASDGSGHVRIAVAYDSTAGDPTDVAVAVLGEGGSSRPRIVGPPERRGELLGIVWQANGRLLAGFAGRPPVTPTPLVVEFPGTSPT